MDVTEVVLVKRHIGYVIIVPPGLSTASEVVQHIRSKYGSKVEAYKVTVDVPLDMTQVNEVVDNLLENC